MRLLGKIIATIFIMLLLVLTIIVALLHTRHAAPVISQLTQRLTNYQFDAEVVTYTITDPWHLTIEQPSVIDPQQQRYQAQQAQIWLAPHETLAALLGFSSSTTTSKSVADSQTQFDSPHWYFDSILISGIDIHQPALSNIRDSATAETTLVTAQTPPRSSLPAIYTHRLALTHFNLTTPTFAISDGQIQLDNWQPSASFWGDFSGDFRIAAPRLDWQQQAFTNILLDGEKGKGNKAHDDWTIYGYSFEWLGASINGQASIDTQARQLILNQLTMTDFHFQSDLTIDQLTQQTNALVSDALRLDSDKPDNIALRIGRLDLIDSQIELNDLSLNQLNLSLLNWQHGRSAWQQTDSQLSLSADSVLWHETVFDSPLLDLRFTPDDILIEGLSSKVWQGYLRANGEITPTSIALNQLTLNNIKAFLPSQWRTRVTDIFAPYQDIQIDELDIGNLQLTDTTPERPFQLSGVNIDGNDLSIKQDNHYGLWQGTLVANAGFASINTIELVEPYISTHSQAGEWQLDQLTIPFKNGLLEATGHWGLAQPAQPWQFTLTTDSAPLLLLKQWFDFPLPLEGNIDSSLTFSGLAHNRASFNYSLVGSLQADFRDTRLLSTPAEFNQQLANWRQTQKTKTTTSGGHTLAQTRPTANVSPRKNGLSTAPLIAVSPLSLTSDRGRITLKPFNIENKDIQATLEGGWDLATPQKQKLRLNVAQSCHQLERIWQHNQQHVSVSPSSCEGNNI